MLKYITRKNIDPSGLPRVYFSCHPADLEECLKVVAEDVLNAANCAIWYEASHGEVYTEKASPEQASLEQTSPEQAFMDIDLTLGTMQLVVLAVTHRFLMEENYARDIVLAYANQHNIPVLPIITEEGDSIWLEFNKLSGGIQMLYRLDTDSTAIPYEEKLERYLKSVLIDDSLAAIIRDAFDAYVFLSYRKKDRKYANELMSRIHENKKYRDIAIWFDEYLVPGEDFTKGIQKVLAKSSIVAMAVTPSLLEPNNYVMEHEYKDARAAGKEIVPVEMVATNRDDMNSNYEALPSIQLFGSNEDEKKAFHDRFLAALKKVAITPKEGSAEHDFYIGLAYLAGIDVEVNRDRAVAMIKESSDNDCIAATQKLVYMYRNGEGVKCNPEKELEYQYTLVRQRRAAYLEHPDISLHLGTTTKYFKSLIELSDMLRERRRIDKSIEAAGKALSLYDELFEEVGAREAGRDKAIVCNRLGGIYREMKKLDEAREYYISALEIYESMMDEITTRRARRDVSISYEKLGNIEKARGSYEQAKASYLKSADIRKALVRENPSASSRRDYSSILTKLGSVYKELGDRDAAISAYEESIIIDEQVEAELGTLRTKRDLSISCEKLGRIYYKQGMIDKAKPLLERTVSLREEIYNTNGSAQYKEELEYAYQKLNKLK